MRRLLTVALAALIAVAADARQDKQPTLPALNVGNAKLIATSPDLGSPLLCVAISEGKGVLIAGCEDGTLRRWKVEKDKDPIDKDSKGETIKAHACPVTCCAAAGATRHSSCCSTGAPPRRIPCLPTRRALRVSGA